MYSEKAKVQGNGIILIFALIFGVYFLSSIIYNFTPEKFKGLYQAGNIIIICFIAAYLLKYRITEYSYTIDDNIFYINKVIGKRETNILYIPVKDILFIDKYSNISSLESYNIKNAKNYGPGKTLRNKYFCLYKKDGEQYLFYFSPSKKLLKLIDNHGDNNV